MTPKEARSIIRDGGLRSLVECTHPDMAPSDDSIPHLQKLYPAYVSLLKHVRKIAKRKVRK
jgi:hypothetical protein